MNDPEGDCITIDSGDDEPEIVEPGRSDKVVESNPATNKKQYAQLRAVTGPSIFEDLICKCEKIKPEADAAKGVKKLRKRFARADLRYVNDRSFVKLVQDNLVKFTSEPWQCMKRVADELKLHSLKRTSKKLSEDETVSAATVTTPVAPENQVDKLDLKTRKFIAKLEITLCKLDSKIRSLEEQEVNFDESDDDSNYLKVERYKKRFCQVHAKIRELKKQTNDEIVPGIRFSGTKIPAVNRAIERFYNDKKEFPDFRDVLKVVQMVNERKNLDFSQAKVHETAKIAFEELGQTLKHQRQYEFHDSLSSYLPEQEIDPADNDENLKEKLADNQKLHGHKIDELINEYAAKQESNNLKAEEVGSDDASGSEEEEEEEEEDDDDNENGDELVSSPSDYEIDIAPEEENEVRPCFVRLYDVTKLPMWEKYSRNHDTDYELDHQQPCCSKSLTPVTADRKRRASDSDSSDSDVVGETKKYKFSSSFGRFTSTPFSEDRNEKKNDFSSECADTDELSREAIVEKVVPMSASESGIEENADDQIENVIIDSSPVRVETSEMEVEDSNLVSKSANNIRENVDDDIANIPTVDDDIANVTTVDDDNPQLSDSLIVQTSQSPDVGNANSSDGSEKPSLTISIVDSPATECVTGRNVPNGITLPSKKSKHTNDDDDDVVIIDEIPSKNRLTTQSSDSKVINVDKAKDSSTVPGNNVNVISTLDLGSFIKNINFRLPNGTSTASAPTRAASYAPLRFPTTLNTSRPRFVAPNINNNNNNYRRISVGSQFNRATLRMSQTGRAPHDNSPWRMSPMNQRLIRPNMLANNRGVSRQAAQDIQRRMMQSNGVRLMQQNQFVATRRITTTTVEESYVRVASAARTSQPVSSRQFVQSSSRNAAFSSTTMQTTRTLVRTQNNTTQKSSSTSKGCVVKDLVTLD